MLTSARGDAPFFRAAIEQEACVLPACLPACRPACCWLGLHTRVAACPPTEPASNLPCSCPQYEGEIHVTIIATGFSQSFEENLWGGGKANVSLNAAAGMAGAAASAAAGSNGANGSSNGAGAGQQQQPGFYRRHGQQQQQQQAAPGWDGGHGAPPPAPAHRRWW